MRTARASEFRPSTAGVWARVALVCALASLPGIGRGASGDVTTILESGDTQNKIDLVFLGDGFTADQQRKYERAVDAIVDALFFANPLRSLRSAFNIHRVWVESQQSGTDYANIDDCADVRNGKLRRTALDTGYCAAGSRDAVHRCVLSSNPELVVSYASRAPAADVIAVVVNDDGYGGCALADTAYLTLHDDAAMVFIHEMGHAAFELADEYHYDGPDRYSGREPPEPNITAEANRSALKWKELVDNDTTIPTQRYGDCSDDDLPSRRHGADKIGTFEGAGTSHCGIYRSQYGCLMRSSEPYCSVCRRHMIRTLSRDLAQTGVTVTFEKLLVRDDHDGWHKGAGEIFMKYVLASGEEIVEGRWPASGEKEFDSGQERDIRFSAGALYSATAAQPVKMSLKVREYDLTDGNDRLSSDANVTLPASGPFTIEEDDYRLKGSVDPAGLIFMMDSVYVKDDRESFPHGWSEIVVKYRVSNGAVEAKGRWPPQEHFPFGRDELTLFVGAMGADPIVLPLPPDGKTLSVTIEIVEKDSGLTGDDDVIGADTFYFDASTGFGADQAVHVRNMSNYRATFSIVRPGYTPAGGAASGGIASVSPEATRRETTE